MNGTYVRKSGIALFCLNLAMRGIGPREDSDRVRGPDHATLLHMTVIFATREIFTKIPNFFMIL